MKKIFAALAVLIIAVSFAFAGQLSVGADIALFTQGVSVRYDFGRWAEVEGVFRMPVVMGIANYFEAKDNPSKTFDPYFLLSDELAVTGYATPLQIGCFSLGIGVEGNVSACVNGPWVSNPGKDNEEQHDSGAAIVMTLKPAVKLQFDFETWGFSIKGDYPVFGYGFNVGDISVGTGFTAAIYQIYSIVRVGFDFKV